MDISDLVQQPADQQTPPDQQPPPPTQPPAVQKKPYWQVLDEYGAASAKEPEIAKMSVPEFSQRMNQATGGNEYDEGLNDSWIRRLAAAPERSFHHFGGILPGEKPLPGIPTPSEMLGGPPTGFDIPESASQAGESFANQLGLGPELSKAVGSGTAGLVTSIPQILAAEAAPPLAPLIFGGTALTEKYGETGKVLPSVISGGVGAAIPWVSDVGGQAFLKGAGAKTIGELIPEDASLLPKAQPATDELLSRYSAAPGWGPSSLIQRGARIAGAQTGLFAAGQAGQAAETLADSGLTWKQKLQQIGAQFSPSNLIASGVSQLPFIPYEIFEARRTNPLGPVQAGIEQNFGERYKAYAARGDPETGSPGFVPTQDDINKVIQGLRTGDVEPSSKEGRILTSMDALPVVQDLKTPIITSQATWPVPDAMNEVRARSQEMLTAQGVYDPLGEKYDQTIYNYLRAAESKAKGTMSKDDMLQQVSSSVVDRYYVDQRQLEDSGVETLTPEQRAQREREIRHVTERENDWSTEIAAAVDPDNPKYNQEAHQRVSLVSGDPEHWLKAGITEPVMYNPTGEAAKVATKDDATGQVETSRRTKTPIQLTRNIVNLMTGMSAKPSLDEAITTRQKQIFNLDRAVKDLQTRAQVEPSEQLNSQIAERQAEMMGLQKELTKLQGNLEDWQRGRQPLWGSSTLEGIRRAYTYDKPLDFKDPASVSRFLNDIINTIKMAEIRAQRIQSGEHFLDKTYDSLAEAENAVLALDDEAKKQRGEYEYSYRVDKDGDGKPVLFKGKYRIVENRYRSLRSVPPTDEAGGEYEEARQIAEHAGEEAPEEPLSGMSKDIKEYQKSWINARHEEIDKYADPAEVLARKRALTENASYFINRMSESDFENALLNFGNIMAGRKEGEPKPYRFIQKIDNIKKQMVRYLQFLGSGGKIEISTTPLSEKTIKDPVTGAERVVRTGGRLKAGPPEALVALNKFMGMEGLGFKPYSAKHARAGEDASSEWNRPGRVGLNFFEQFAVIADRLREKLIDPRALGDWQETRPLGDFGYAPKKLLREEDKGLLVKWGPELEKGAFGVPLGTFPEVKAGGRLQIDTTDRQGNKRSFIVDKNPLQTFFIKAPQYDLTMPLNKLIDLFERYGNPSDTSRNMIAVTRKLMSMSPFLRDMPVGASPAIDPAIRAYFHTDSWATSAGMLISPYDAVDPKLAGGTFVKQLLSPEAIFPHLINEVGHASADYAYNRFPEFKAQVDQVFAEVNKWIKANQLENSKSTEETQTQPHFLKDPQEFLASIFNNADLHELLRNIPDMLEPLPNTPATGSLFDRVMNMLRNLFTKIFNLNDPDAKNMLNRMTQLAARGVELQQGLNLLHRGDIYAESYERNLVDKEAVAGLLRPEARKPGMEITGGGAIYPPTEGRPGPPERVPSREPLNIDSLIAIHTAQFNDARKALAEARKGEDAAAMAQAQARVDQERRITNTLETMRGKVPEPKEPGATPTPSMGVEPEYYAQVILDHAKANLADAQYRHSTNPDEFPAEWVDGAKKLVKIAEDRIAAGEVPQNLSYLIRNHESMLADAQAKGQADEVTRQQAILTRLRDIQAKRGGAVLESRADPQAVLSSMKSAALYTNDDGERVWFSPYSDEYFRGTYGPWLGAKLVYEPRGREVGYSVSKRDLQGVSEWGLSWMPKPKVKMWAPSLFETAKSLFREQGSDDQTASAQASYVTQFGALLRSTDQAIWGRIPPEEQDGQLVGRAWGWYRRAGLTPEFATQTKPPETTIRHEATHLAGMHPYVEYEPMDIQRAYKQINDVFTSLDENGRKAFLDGLTNVTAEDGKWPGRYDAAIFYPSEFGAEFMAHIGDVITNVPKPSAFLRDEMRFVPDEMANLLIKNTLRRQQGLGTLVRLIESEGRVRNIKNVDWQDMVNRTAKAFEPLARSALDIATDIAEFYRSRFVFPDEYRSLLKETANVLDEFQTQATAEGAEEPTPRLPGTMLASKEGGVVNFIRRFIPFPDPSGNIPGKLGLWDKELTQFSQLADKFPVLRPAWSMFSTARAILSTNKLKTDTALAGAFQGDKLYDDARTKDVHKFIFSPTMRDAFDHIALDLNSYGDHIFKDELADKGDIMNMDPQIVQGWKTPAFVNAMLDKYGIADKDKKAMLTVLDGTRNQIKESNAIILDAFLHRIQTTVAIAASRAANLEPEQARNIAQVIMDAAKMQTTDINGAMQKLNQVRQMVPNVETFGKIFDLANAGVENAARLARFLELRMEYFYSERRPGKFGLFFRDDNDKITSRYFANDKDRSKYIENNNVEPVRQTNPGDKDWGISPEVFRQLDDVQDRMMDKLKGAFGEDEADKLAVLMDMTTDLRDALNSRDVLKLTTARQLAPGREELDMFAAHQQYIGAVRRGAYNNFIRMETELLNTAPSLANLPEMKDYINRQAKAVMLPDAWLGRQMQKLSFFYYLWGNVSSMIMQMSHQVMGLAPQLTAKGATWAGSFKTIAQANKMVLEAGLKGKLKDPELQAMVDRATQEGKLGSWVSRELDFSDDLSMANRIRATGGQGLWTPFDMLKNKLYQGFKLMRDIYDIVPAYNAKIALLSSILHLRSEAGGSLRGEELYQEANFLREITMFTGGKENRPGMFQHLPRSAAQGLWSLQTYANGLTTMMGELIRRSVIPQKGFTPAQTKQVRKAAAQMLITQTAVAGVLGLPFAQGIAYALQKLFPEHNIEGDIRDALASLFGDDEQTGNAFSSSMMMGIPSTFSYAPDLGSRFALAGTFHVSPYSGVGWEQLVGPTGGVLSRAVEALQAGLRGDPVGTVEELMPNGFQRIWKALEQGQSYQTDSGQMVASDLRPEEIVARMIGFRPSRVARIEEFERLSRVSEDAAKTEQTAWTKKQAGLMIQNRDSEAQQNLARRVAESKGLYPAQRLASDIGREVERETMPANLRSFGNRATILEQKRLQGILGTQSEGPSNFDRIQLQQNIAQRLGLRGPNIGSMRHASRVDQLLSMYPHLTDAQANLLLTHAVASRPTPELYSELLGESE